MPGHSPPSHTVPTTTNRNANASDTVLMSPRCGCNTTTSAAVATTATTQPATVFLMVLTSVRIGSPCPAR